ncbi:glutamate--tRNA ligase, partial [Candidatus Peregrinibacteria bacterium CG10_big_fil_rev_8_21_14_0_10_49_10]
GPAAAESSSVSTSRIRMPEGFDEETHGRVEEFWRTGVLAPSLSPDKGGKSNEKTRRRVLCSHFPKPIEPVFYICMRTRFPPSPTGMLHVGGLRTALFSYLLAKQSDGDFLLRIEDTDRERSVEGAVENILGTLHWAGLHPDEGVMLEGGKIIQKGEKGPYIQSERLEIYKDYAKQLVDAGQAYYAFDTKEEIDRMREEAQKAGNPAPKYDLSVRLRMRNALTMDATEVEQMVSAGEPYVIRLKVPENRTVTVQDEIRGKVEFKTHTVDDAILLKSDGFPTYHLANIVDDHLMDIDLVLRGEEWLSSLPKHILLYEAFGWQAPKFAHVPLLLNKEGGGKLSKRQGDVAASDFIAKGYLPEALLNFLALLGWNPGGTQELFTMEELITQFSLERVQKGGAVFDTEKLDWLQGQWMRKFSPEEFTGRIRPTVQEVYPAAADDPDFAKKATLIQERITFFAEAPEMLSYYYTEPVFNMELVASKKQKVTVEMVPGIIDFLIKALSPLDDNDGNWQIKRIENVLESANLNLSIKLKDGIDISTESESGRYTKGQYLWPLRAILTGLPYSPGAFEVVEVLGKEKTLERLQKAKELAEGMKK